MMSPWSTGMPNAVAAVVAVVALAVVVAIALFVRRARARADAARRAEAERAREDDFKLRTTPRPIASLVYGPKSFRRPRGRR